MQGRGLAIRHLSVVLKKQLYHLFTLDYLHYLCSEFFIYVTRINPPHTFPHIIKLINVVLSLQKNTSGSRYILASKEVTSWPWQGLTICLCSPCKLRLILLFQSIWILWVLTNQWRIPSYKYPVLYTFIADKRKKHPSRKMFLCSTGWNTNIPSVFKRNILVTPFCSENQFLVIWIIPLRYIGSGQ